MTADKEILNLSTVQDVLADCVNEVRRLDGASVADKSTVKDAKSAEINRRLLSLADALQLASVLVRNEYWAGRGGMSYEL